jgi:hypothetical protein
MHGTEYISVMSKATRQKAILEILREDAIPSQEDLQGALLKKGFRVGQATLSRDIREIGLVKSSEGYELPQGVSVGEPALSAAQHPDAYYKRCERHASKRPLSAAKRWPQLSSDSYFRPVFHVEPIVMTDLSRQ